MEPLPESELLTCVEAAIKAPSIHNTQPWLFLPRPDGVEVYADVSRRLPAIDPHGRAMHISLGAAVLGLRLGMAALGHRPLSRLLPTASDHRHVATVTAAGPYAPTSDDLELFAAIARRRSNRHPFTDALPPRSAIERLENAASQEGAVLHFADAAECGALLSVARTADARQRSNPAYRAELRMWTTDDPYREDGVPLEAVGPLSEDGAFPIRDYALEREVPDRRFESFEPEPVVATLGTVGEDGPAEWLLAGQALQRVLLEATRLGLSAGLFTQPLEDPQLRGLLTDHSRLVTPQVVLRVGYGPPVPPNPRRPPEEVIVTSRPVPLRPPRHF